MVDEIITFFLAGSFTLRSVNSNMIMYLCKYPDVKKKLMSEIINTHLKGLVNEPKPVDTEKVYTFQSVENLKYFVNCFYESLRMEPPTVVSGGIYTEDQTFPNGLRVKKGDFLLSICRQCKMIKMNGSLQKGLCQKDSTPAALTTSDLMATRETH